MLPIDQVLTPLLLQIEQQPSVVLQAPPGAGKTTRVPLALLQCPWLAGKIILIQPRRLAVYGAAHRLAYQLGETPGATIGYRTRYDRKLGNNTKIEIVTDGIFLAQIQRDPELNGVGLVIFDEFHERSASMDLGLAFALESQSALRDQHNPLRLLVMSATLDGERLSQWLQAPLIQSQGRSFPVQTLYRPKPVNTYSDQHIGNVILEALRNQTGSLLVFLPGMKEIRAVIRVLENAALEDHIDILPLHASLPQDQQQRALQPAANERRKVVLSTNVAETSITIEDVCVVIDSGQVRVARYDERRGSNVLCTETICAASAEQRRGRAGRTQAGSCYRLWSAGKQATLLDFSDPEILTTDLAPIALELACWGAADASELTLLDAPEQAPMQRARNNLLQLGALRENNTITPFGKRLHQLGLPPRLAALLWSCRHSANLVDAVACAAVLSEGDPLRLPADQFQADIHLRLELLQQPNQHNRTSQHKRLHTLRKQLLMRVQQLAETAPADPEPNLSLAQALAQAFPDHIAQQRSNNKRRYRMSNGKGCQLQRNDKLSQHPYLVILETSGNGTDATVQLACSISQPALEQALGSQLQQKECLYWDQQKQAVTAEHQTCLGALVLDQKPLTKPWPDTAIDLLQNALLENHLEDLPWNDQSRAFCARLNWLATHKTTTWPDYSKAALIQEADNWLRPYLITCTSFKEVARINLLEALKSRIPWDAHTLAEQAAPEHWLLPTGTRPAINYQLPSPTLSARLQEFYGMQQHPTLPCGQKLTLELLSPAHRPIQVTQDLPGFWQGSYSEVAKEMRGRYPKHFWPDNPATATATTRTKRAMDQNRR